MKSRERIRPLLLRAADPFGLSPWSVGLLVLLLAGLGVALVAGFGEDLGPEAPQELRVAIILALLLGFLPAAQRFVDMRAQQSFDELRGLLEPEPIGPSEWQHRIATVDRRVHRRAMLVAVAILFAGSFLPEALSIGSFALDQIPGLSILHRIYVPILALFAGSMTTSNVTSSHILSEACRTQGRVDLFDSDPWRPLARLGVANAVATVGVISILLLLIPDREAGVGLAILLACVLLVLTVGAGASLLLPMWGLRQHIRAQKSAQQAAYQRELNEILGEPHSTPGRLADLAAFGRLLDDVQEWPIGLPQIGRLTLLLGLPLGSWIASALVERLLDALLG